jgi:hypothetical protein
MLWNAAAWKDDVIYFDDIPDEMLLGDNLAPYLIQILDHVCNVPQYKKNVWSRTLRKSSVWTRCLTEFNLFTINFKRRQTLPLQKFNATGISTTPSATTECVGGRPSRGS